MKKQTVHSLPIQNKKVLVRVDFNVPMENGKITDDTRIQESLPTILYLLQQNAAVILCSHLGRPKGVPNPKYSLEPVAKKLSELLTTPPSPLSREISAENGSPSSYPLRDVSETRGLFKGVKFVKDCIGQETRSEVSALKPGEILLLENLRFHPEEEKNEENFARELASLADFFVQDAFGAVHRAHASTSAITKFLPSAAGFLLKKEIEALSRILNPQRPFIAILGGAKVSDKIAVIQNLLSKVDSLFIGGAMAYTFLFAKGVNVGNSLVEKEKIELALRLLDSKIELPLDHRIATNPKAASPTQLTEDFAIPENFCGVDIGPKSLRKIESLLKDVRTIFWNGPLGIFEIPEFSFGTMECAKLVAQATKQGAYSVVGGGDSVAAVKQSGVADSISHISTGGGASLEFLEGKELPGIASLPNK